MSNHVPYVNAWVFIAIAGTKPERGARLALPEVLDGADYFERAVISKDELEHGIRDLARAGLIDADGDSFTPTRSGRELFHHVWREYEVEYSRTHRAGPVPIAQTKLEGLSCAANEPGWSVTQREWEDAVAAYRASFEAELQKVDPGEPPKRGAE